MIAAVLPIAPYSGCRRAADRGAIIAHQITNHLVSMTTSASLGHPWAALPIAAASAATNMKRTCHETVKPERICRANAAYR